MPDQHQRTRTAHHGRAPENRNSKETTMIRTPEEVRAIGAMDRAAQDALDLLESAIERVNDIQNVNYYRLPLKRAAAELRAVYRRDEQGAA